MIRYGALTRRFFASAAAGNKVGFYGMGNMGMHMIRNLKKTGFAVKCYDVVPESRERAAAEGLDVCSDPGEAAQDVDFIVTCLPNTKIVETVLTKDIFNNAALGTVICDTSTILPTSS